MQLFKNYVGVFKFGAFFAVFARFIAGIAELWVPKILSIMIDDIALQQDTMLTIKWGGFMILVSLFATTLNLSSNYFASNISTKVGKNVRRDLFSKIMELSSAQVDKITIGSLETRMTTDIYNIQQVIGMMMRIGIKAPILLIGGIFMAFTLDFALALVILCALPIIMVCIFFISKRGIKLFEIVQFNEDVMASSVRENVLGVRVIKALVAKDFEAEKFQKINQNLTKADIKTASNMVLSNPTITMILNISSVAVVVVSCSRITNGYCDVGVLLAFVTYFTIIQNALTSISRIFIMCTKGIVSANRVQEILDFKSDLLLEEAKPLEVKENKELPYICFENVNFSYETFKDDEDISNHQMNLENIEFNLNKGDTLGIIGATGSGKSTLLLLLMRFYDVSSGAIYINGKNVKSIPLAKLHKMFGVVLQSDYLFSDTIMENITFGRDLDKDEVEESVKVAQAKKFVESYDDTYEHKLTIKGSNLSGGQKQRLLIARAVAGSPNILILDDSSSALDYKTDAMLREELSKTRKETTTVLVAQRISSIKDANLIIMLENGKILSMGTHEELLENCKEYRELSEHQLGVVD